jgi:hypothetical protein
MIMKKYILITLGLLLALFINTASTQEMQTLFGGGEKQASISGFAGIFNEFSGFNGEFAFSMGGGAALLIDQRFYIGGYGLGLTTRHLNTVKRIEHYSAIENTIYPDLYTHFGHGGFWLGYIHNPHKAIHWSVSTKLGWGAVSLTDKLYRDYQENWNNIMVDNVFVITPQVDLNMNLLKWMRMSVGVGYRAVTGVDKTYKYYPNNDPLEVPVEKAYFDKNALNSVTGNITLAFGWFNN